MRGTSPLILPLCRANAIAPFRSINRGEQEKGEGKAREGERKGKTTRKNNFTKRMYKITPFMHQFFLNVFKCDRGLLPPP